MGFPLTGSTSYFSIPPHWTVSTTASSWTQGCDPFLFWAPIVSVPSRTSQSTPCLRGAVSQHSAFWEGGRCILGGRRVSHLQPPFCTCNPGSHSRGSVLTCQVTPSGSGSIGTSGLGTCSHPALYTSSCSRLQHLRLQGGTFTLPRAGCCLLLRSDWNDSEISFSEDFLSITSLSLTIASGGFDLLYLLKGIWSSSKLEL